MWRGRRQRGRLEVAVVVVLLDDDGNIDAAVHNHVVRHAVAAIMSGPEVQLPAAALELVHQVVHVDVRAEDPMYSIFGVLLRLAVAAAAGANDSDERAWCAAGSNGHCDKVRQRRLATTQVCSLE